MRPSTRPLVNWLLLLLLLFFMGRFAIQSYGRMLTNSNASEGDQSAFLQLGLDLQEHATLTDGTRNPLYPAALALIAEREWDYFTWAKFLSMGFGLLAIAALYWLGRRQFDPFTGLAAAYLLSINVEFIVHSATVLTESLLVLTFILSWFTMLRALNQPRRPGLWLLAGLLVGLAYLAKGSSQLLAASFLLVALGWYRLTLFKMRGLWLFLAGYALVASPLWLYNLYHFGSPTFNYAITHQMWMEGWREWHPDDVANLPTLSSYLADHSLAEIISRQWTGMKAMRNILIKTLWPTRTLLVDHFLLSPWSGYVLAGLALLPLLFWRASQAYLRARPGAVYLTGLVSLLFFLLFAWYVPIVALGQRFLLPVIPLIFVLAAHLTSRLGQKIMAQGRWPRRLLLLVGAILLIWQGRWALRTTSEPFQALRSQNVFAQDRRFNADAAAPLEWLAGNTPPARVVAWGPPNNTLPTWAYSDRLTFKLYPPDFDTLPALTENLVRREVDFVIVGPEMVSRYRTPLKEFLPPEGSRLALATIPDGWALAFAYRTMPCDWCVFRLVDSHPPDQRVDYALGPSLALTGYYLPRSSYQPGDTLPLTLHWQARGPIEQDYTIFTQLLGPDFQLHGQLDRPPLHNQWPTSRWSVNDRIADRFDIPLEPDAPPGQYQLLVGMYQPASGERLPVWAAGTKLPDAAIPLATLTVTGKGGGGE